VRTCVQVREGEIEGAREWEGGREREAVREREEEKRLLMRWRRDKLLRVIGELVAALHQPSGAGRGTWSPTTRRGHTERERHGALRSRALHIRCTPVAAERAMAVGERERRGAFSPRNYAI